MMKISNRFVFWKILKWEFMSHNYFFQIITIIILCTSGCTMPFNEKEVDEVIIGCKPGDDEKIIEESCSITTGDNNTEEIPLFENEKLENNSSSNSTQENTVLQNNSSSNCSNIDNSNIGVNEGMNIPNFKTLIHYYNSTKWTEFEFYSLFDNCWNSSNNSNLKWTAVIFISTDCSHCWNSGDDISIIEDEFNDEINLLILAVNFSTNNNFNATKEEIVAFQEKNDYFGCYSNTKNCMERPGDPHTSPYLDDRNQSIMYEWDVTGTPAQFIIKPNGIVAWNVYEHRTSSGGDGENFDEALNRLLN